MAAFIIVYYRDDGEVKGTELQHKKGPDLRIRRESEWCLSARSEAALGFPQSIRPLKPHSSPVFLEQGKFQRLKPTQPVLISLFRSVATGLKYEGCPVLLTSTGRPFPSASPLSPAVLSQETNGRFLFQVKT